MESRLTKLIEDQRYLVFHCFATYIEVQPRSETSFYTKTNIIKRNTIIFVSDSVVSTHLRFLIVITCCVASHTE
ncbi:Hypothetical predicted protein [Octopus vulgaris]|uniref:Uncharacterized protein n=1 Tax=Octopus vulgaris TaxID=6645 RepID=A0AA36BEJ4_OCTVU|nr:Hypothetical predicted protein [Octopus vulgaris]